MTSLADRLRMAFAESAPDTDRIIADDRGADRDQQDIVPAAVLMAVIDAPEPRLLLTLRHAGLRSHAGQVAFPGGRLDAGDDSPVAGALREAEEEVGLPRGRVEVIGQASRYRTNTGYEITPVLATIPDGLVLMPHEAEVAAIFEPPLGFVLDPANRIRRSMEWRGAARHFHEIMWQDYRIWGVTAALILDLGCRLATFR